MSGQLTEAVYVASGLRAGTLRERAHPAERSVGFDHHYVHDVRNRCEAPAVSVHAYSRPLTSMTYYDVEDGELVALATVATTDPEAEVDSRSRP